MSSPGGGGLGRFTGTVTMPRDEKSLFESLFRLLARISDGQKRADFDADRSLPKNEAAAGWQRGYAAGLRTAALMLERSLDDAGELERVVEELEHGNGKGEAHENARGVEAAARAHEDARSPHFPAADELERDVTRARARARSRELMAAEFPAISAWMDRQRGGR